MFCCVADAEPAEDGALAGSSVAEDGWFGNNSDSPSASSYDDVQDDLRMSPEDGARPDTTALAGSPPGCATPARRVSLELLGLDARTLSSQDMSLVSSVSLSSMVSSLYGDSAHGLSKPLSSNLRRLLESGSVKLESGEPIGRGPGRGAESPPAGLALSPSSHHAQQLSALARRLANSSNNGVGSSASTSPASAPAVKQEPGDPFGPAEPASSGSTGFVWVGMAEKWPPAGSLSPDSAIQKLKAAANAVLQDKNSTSSSSSSSSSSVTSSSSSSSCSSSSVPPLGGRPDDAVRFDSFASPFSSQSASSTLAALSKKVSERSQQQQQQQQQPSAAPFLSLVSMTSSAALLKEVAARAAGNMLADKKEPQLATANAEDSKAQLDRNHKAPTPNQSMELLLPAAPKGRTKPSSQAGNSLSAPWQMHVNNSFNAL